MGFRRIENPISLCHVHVPYRPAFLALRLKRKKGIPFVVTEHWSGHLNGEYLRKNRTDRLLYRRVLAKASGISTVSALLAQKFKTHTGFDSVVIPNCIEADNSLHPISRKDPKIQLLSVSDMIDSIKNISGLVRSFGAAAEKRNDLHLTLVGGGPDEQKIQNLIQEHRLQDKITFKGRLAHASVLEEMKRCDFYICNSNVETFGMTAAEALLSGKPVISTRCGGPEEFLNDSNALLVNPNDSDQLTDAILKMSDGFNRYSPELLATAIDQRFGKSAVKQKLVSFYNAVI